MNLPEIYGEKKKKLNMMQLQKARASVILLTRFLNIRIKNTRCNFLMAER